jgi:hypothetical protein
VRRIVTTIAALAVAFLIYGTLLVLLVQRMTAVLIVCDLRGTPRSAPPPPIRVVDGQVHVPGATVPLMTVIGAATVPPLWWLTATLYDAKVRRTRERLGQCLECGQPLSKRRGRCPRCGVRFERAPLPPPLSTATPRKHGGPLAAPSGSCR